MFFESLNHSFTLLSVKNRMVTVVESWHIHQTFIFTGSWIKTMAIRPYHGLIIQNIWVDGWISWFRYTFCWYFFVIWKIVNISFTSCMKSIRPILARFVNTFGWQGMIFERLNLISAENSYLMDRSLWYITCILVGRITLKDWYRIFTWFSLYINASLRLLRS